MRKFGWTHPVGLVPFPLNIFLFSLFPLYAYVHCTVWGCAFKRVYWKQFCCWKLQVAWLFFVINIENYTPARMKCNTKPFNWQFMEILRRGPWKKKEIYIFWSGILVANLTFIEISRLFKILSIRNQFHVVPKFYIAILKKPLKIF